MSSTHTDDVNALNLKVTPPLPQPPIVRDYDVPIFNCDLQNVSDLEWDLGIQQVGAHVYPGPVQSWNVFSFSLGACWCIYVQIIPHIDGFKHLARIASETDMDREIVRASVQHLVCVV